MEENVFNKGDLFWDKENCQLIEYDENCKISEDDSCVIVCGTSVASDIPLSKDVLIGIGFQYDSSKFRYIKDNCIIDEDYAASDSVYKFCGKTIKYLRELQNRCKANKVDLKIDKVQLKKILMCEGVDN